ncbi:MAG: helix-turn-helix transcriptional regulator [Candidatus Limivivens sp.]|nr:helix-turn-helix transcriptional regulator [Candidatus Limivivens sp.]
MKKGQEMQTNVEKYIMERETRQKRLEAYAEKIQEKVLHSSSETIKELVEERHRQKMTQQEIADITGILPSNLARFESGTRVPTLIVLEKYASALGKHIKVEICDDDTGL